MITFISRYLIISLYMQIFKIPEMTYSTVHTVYIVLFRVINKPHRLIILSFDPSDTLKSNIQKIDVLCNIFILK